jgi:DNA-binding response OmpR family regulator
MKKAVVLEDDKVLLGFYRLKLEQRGYEVLCLENGIDALEKIISFKPNVIIIDLVLPQKDGFEVIKELKNNPETKSILTIVVTDLGGEEDKQKTNNYGVDKHYDKTSFSFKDILNDIEKNFPAHF